MIQRSRYTSTSVVLIVEDGSHFFDSIFWGTGRDLGVALLRCPCALSFCGLLCVILMCFRIFNLWYGVLNYGQKDEEFMEQ